MRDFNHTVNVLVQAYLNDTLKHMDCAACAVGNIVADALECRIVNAEEVGWAGLHGNYWERGGITYEPIWHRLFFTPRPQAKQRRWPKRYRGVIKKQIEATGYTWQELALIERAFESVPVPYFSEMQLSFNVDHEKWMFDGLMKVVDCLADIHGINLEATNEAKKLFQKV
jgi:hypothetical protein